MIINIFEFCGGKKNENQRNWSVCLSVCLLASARIAHSATSSDVATALGNYCIQSEAGCAQGISVTYNSSGNCTCNSTAYPYWAASSRKCVNCEAGNYVNSSGDCIPCSAGTYSDKDGATSCVTCSEGKWSAAGATNCYNISSYTSIGLYTSSRSSLALDAGCYMFVVKGGGGGGGGGWWNGGGGGGSGYTKTVYKCFYTPDNISFTIGSGGAGGGRSSNGSVVSDKKSSLRSAAGYRAGNGGTTTLNLGTSSTTASGGNGGFTGWQGNGGCNGGGEIKGRYPCGSTSYSNCNVSSNYDSPNAVKCGVVGNPNNGGMGGDFVTSGQYYGFGGGRKINSHTPTSGGGNEGYLGSGGGGGFGSATQYNYGGNGGGGYVEIFKAN